MVSITNADLEIYVTENSVTTVIWKDNARVLAFGDVVRITDRDGIRYEFLYTDVIAPTSPAYSSAEELADEINTYLITIPGGGGGGTITDVTATAPLTSSGGATPDISTLMASGKLIGRHSSGSGVFQEITLGSNLSLSGDTLNATGGGGGGLLSGNATQVSAGVYTSSITGVTAYSAGDAYLIKFGTANDGASTININALGAKNIFKNTNVPIASGDIKANQEIMIVYDGTNFQAIGLIYSQLLAYVHNAEGAVINKGQVVYAYQATGNKMSVKLARADSDATSAKTIGLVYDSSIGIGGEGYIIIQGVIEGINTAAFNAGDTLYLSGTTFGGVTATKPHAPTHLVYVGIVERANAGNGQIYVRCQNGYELDEIHDVALVSPYATPVNNDVLTYITGTPNLWQARSVNSLVPNLLNGSFGVTVDGIIGIVQVGTTGYVVMPYDGTITSWVLTANASGTVSFDITKASSGVIPTVSIIGGGGVYPTLSSQQIVTGSNLTAWITTFSAGDVFGFSVRASPAPATIKNVTLTIRVTRS